MKTKTYIKIIAAALLIFNTGQAQTLPETAGAVTISNVQMEQKNGTLQLTFQAHITNKALNNRQSWSIIPELKAHKGTQNHLFPYLLINGKQKERHYKRKINFKNTELTNNLPVGKTSITKQTDTTLTYITQIPYEPWMENSTLRINQLLTSPRNKKQLFVIADCGQFKKTETTPPSPPVTPPEPEITIRQQSIKAFARIGYPVGDSRIHPGYRNNPRELKNIEEEFQKIRQNPQAEIISIHITGYASPEGSLSLNERLSRERVEAFKNHLINTQGIPAEKIHTAGIAEDWDGFRDLIEAKEIPGKDTIMAIIQSNDSPDEKEKKLRRHPQWQTLIWEIFPELRRTEYQIDIIITETK